MTDQLPEQRDARMAAALAASKPAYEAASSHRSELAAELAEKAKSAAASDGQLWSAQRYLMISASMAALAFIASCRERGFIPAWSCAATNEPSVRLARSLGFVEFREITGFELGSGWASS